VKRITTTFIAGVCFVGLLGTTASASLGPRQAVTYEYEVRAMGATVGKATLEISSFKKVDQRILREVKLTAATSGLGKSVYNSNTVSRTWVDALWLPVKAKWDYSTPKGDRKLKANYWRKGKKGGAVGVYKRKGKKDYKTNFRLNLRPTDLVSVFAMIPNSRLKPGKSLRIPMYDGWRVYDLKAKVGKPAMLESPLKKGKVKALPVVITAKAGKYERRVVYWLDARTHEPLQLSFSYGMLGSVDAVLVKAKKKTTKPLRLTRR